MNQDGPNIASAARRASPDPSTLFEDMAMVERWICVYAPRVYASATPPGDGKDGPAASLIALFRRGSSRSLLLEEVLLPELGLRLELLLLLGLLLLLRLVVRRRHVKEAEDGALCHLGGRA